MKRNILKIILLIFTFSLFSCIKYKDDIYLSHIEIVNSLYDDKSTIYFESDIFGDSIVEIPYLKKCIVPINHLWENTNYSSENTTDRIHNEIIKKNNFNIFRLKNGKKNNFSFKKFRFDLPHDGATYIKRIDNVVYVHYDIFTEEEYFE